MNKYHPIEQPLQPQSYNKKHRGLYSALCILFVILIITAGSLLIFMKFTKPSDNTTNNDLLNALNQSFITNHESAKLQFLSLSKKPVGIIWCDGSYSIVKSGDDINGNIAKISYLPNVYRFLQIISHIPVTITAMLASYLMQQQSSSNISNDKTRSLTQYLQQLKEAAPEVLNRRIFNETQQFQRQMYIYNTSIASLEKFLNAQSISVNDILNYSRSLQAALEMNINDASHVQIDALRSKVLPAFKATTSSVDDMYVISQGQTTANGRSNLIAQFFQSTLLSSSTAPRIFYSTKTTLVDLLLVIAGFEIDADASTAFFDNSSALTHDLMSNTGSTYLNELYNEKKLPGEYEKPRKCPFS